MKISVIGGDMRQYYAAEYLKNEGYEVLSYGLPESEIITPVYDIKAALESEIIILPLPVSRDGETLNAPYLKENVPLDGITSAVCENQRVFGGMMPFAYPNYTDYYKNEALLYQNSLATAEGAVMHLMENSPRTLYGQRVLVTGYGRLGKVLAPMLAAFSCSVTVSARRPSDINAIKQSGFFAADTTCLTPVMGRFDAVINTVPHTVIGEAELDASRNECIFIELASAPYGIDFAAAKALKRTVINLPALPAKYCPVSAGEFIAKAVLNTL